MLGLLKKRYFHYGSEKRSDPIGSLKNSIEEAGGKPEVEGSLIVLPEAFNLKALYGNDACLEFEANAEESLMQIAAQYEVVFVAGLILQCGSKYSTACFITSDRPSVLSQKKGCDSACPRIYMPCDDPKDEVVEHGQACVAALICMDVQEDNSRRNRLVDRIKLCSCPVLCVPANTRYRTATFGSDLPQIHVVVANGCSLDPVSEDSNYYSPSIISIRGEVKKRFQDKTNVIHLQCLSP